MAIQTTNITLDGLVHTLDDRDRVAAQLVAENENTFTGGNNFGVKLLTAGASNTVTAADSGKIIVFNVAAATLCTLPAPKIGMKFTFITSIGFLL